MHTTEINELVAALSKAQGAMKPAAFNRVNPHFKSKYADLASVTAAAQEPLSSNGLAITQTIEIGETTGSMLITTLWHASGQYIRSEYPISMAGRPQEVGSMLTYARRYAFSAMLGIVSEDDDGNGADDQHKKHTPPKPAPRVVPPSMRERANPETGEVMPHAITAADDEQWGQELISEIRFAKDELEVDKWVQSNKDRLLAIENGNPKLYKVIGAAAKEKRASLRTAAAEGQTP